MILGITGHKGILGKSIINYIKKYEKSNYKISLYKNNVLDFEKLEKWIDKIDIISPCSSYINLRSEQK